MRLKSIERLFKIWAHFSKSPCIQKRHEPVFFLIKHNVRNVALNFVSCAHRSVFPKHLNRDELIIRRAARTDPLKTQWIGINQIIEDLAFEASVAMFIGLIEDLQVQGQQGQHLTFHI
ncbi:hypothetical protein M8J77_007168 [Diaphorina citri]|nr:hypothetical protein M8J77_007168 [Diaphorina citri]